MPEYNCTVELHGKRELKLFARDECQAKEKAILMVCEWLGVPQQVGLAKVECIECEAA